MKKLSQVLHKIINSFPILLLNRRTGMVRLISLVTNRSTASHSFLVALHVRWGHGRIFCTVLFVRWLCSSSGCLTSPSSWAFHLLHSASTACNRSKLALSISFQSSKWKSSHDLSNSWHHSLISLNSACTSSLARLWISNSISDSSAGSSNVSSLSWFVLSWRARSYSVSHSFSAHKMASCAHI